MQGADSFDFVAYFESRIVNSFITQSRQPATAHPQSGCRFKLHHHPSQYPDETLILDFTVEHYTGLQSIVDAFNALEEGAFAHFDATTQSDNLNLAAVETQAGVEYSLVIIGIPETPAS